MTYSIVARDPGTGELGVAVQSHFFSVGGIVPWARVGVGAVATQAQGRRDYGPRGLALMADGASAAQALSALRSEDPGAETRQVAMVDAHGGVACVTGSQCISFAADVQGDGVSCQANIMAREGVPEAMLAAFSSRSGPLARRLLAALVAAEDLGGDLRGRQSAALLVVPGEGEPWDVDVSLRVEDDPDPLGELARLLDVHDAYRAAGDVDVDASASSSEVAALRASLPELRFWDALTLAASDEDAAVAALSALCAEDPAWRELLTRLPDERAPGLLARLP